MYSLVVPVISTLLILRLLFPTNVVTSPNFPGLSGNEIHNVELYSFVFGVFGFPLACH